MPTFEAGSTRQFDLALAQPAAATPTFVLRDVDEAVIETGTVISSGGAGTRFFALATLPTPAFNEHVIAEWSGNLTITGSSWPFKVRERVHVVNTVGPDA